MSRKVQQATPCFLIEDDKVLLAMKKRGFGKGWWNGLGGKFDSSMDKNIVNTAKRETKEEINVIPLNLRKVAILHFYFPDDPKKRGWNQDVHVFISKRWNGKPKETEEMKPKWFRFFEVPYKKMWDGDYLWIPRVLSGEKIMAKMGFDKNNKLVRHAIEGVKEF